MSEITDGIRQDLTEQAQLIRGADTANFNTAERVGKLFEEMIPYLGGSGSNQGNNNNTASLPAVGTVARSLWTTSNPSPNDTNRVLQWDGQSWSPIPTPTGGGVGGGLTWDALAANTSEPINISHLTGALSGYPSISALTQTNSKYTWWGNQMTSSGSGSSTLYKVEGPLQGGITFVKFTKGGNSVYLGLDTNGNLVLSSNEDGTGTANFYATGGVSCLGNSSSGSGTPGTTPSDTTPANLGDLLTHLNIHSSSFDNSSPTLADGTTSLGSTTQGATLRWNGSEWTVDMTKLSDISEIPTPSSGSTYLQYRGAGQGYAWVSITPGTGNINNLSNIGDVDDYSSATTNGILTYIANPTSGHEHWQYKSFSINGSGSSSPYTLTSINYAGNTYNIPTLPAATTDSLGGIKLGYTQNNKNYPVALSDNKAYVNVPWTDNDHTYEGGAGITVGSSPSQSGNYPISVVLTDGGGLAFDNSGKLKISNTYGGTKYLFGNPYWQNGLPQSYGYDNSHLTDINYVTNIYLQSSSTAAATALTMRDPGATNDTNSFVIRKNSTYAEIYNRKSTEPLLVTPGSYMAVGQGNIPSTTIANYINGCMLWSNGSLVVGTSVTDTTSSITLGGAVLKWDETNKALYVQRKDGSAANFYATGGVSALGFSNGVSSIDAMTFNNLTVNNTATLSTANAVNLKATTSIKLGNDWTLSLSDGNLKFAKGTNDFAIISFNGNGELCLDGNAIQTS